VRDRPRHQGIGQERRRGRAHLRRSQGHRLPQSRRRPHHHRRRRQGRHPGQGEGPVTVRTNLDRFVGGAKEETIIARVGEGIVTTIGSAESYKSVLESPDSISKTVLQRGLDVGSAFEILSIDIADVDVGENVGAKLQEAQAEANKNMAQAQAEIRRAAAVALEQEMKARVQEMQAKVVEAQAQVPLAQAEAFRNGRLGVMDFYRMENVQADTQMRSSIAHPEGKK